MSPRLINSSSIIPTIIARRQSFTQLSSSILHGFAYILYTYPDKEGSKAAKQQRRLDDKWRLLRRHRSGQPGPLNRARLMVAIGTGFKGSLLFYQVYQLPVTLLLASRIASPSRGSTRTPTWLDKIARLAGLCVSCIPRHESDYPRAKLITITGCGCDKYWRAKSRGFRCKDRGPCITPLVCVSRTRGSRSASEAALLTNGELITSLSRANNIPLERWRERYAISRWND